MSERKDLDVAFSLFAKTPLLGQVKTRLAADIGDQAAFDLYLAFTADCLARLSNLDKRLGRYLYLTSPWNSEKVPFPISGQDLVVRYQVTGDLGARMEAAMEELFAFGYGAGIIIGADTPSLPRSYLTEAVNALRDSDCVIGPTEDGGYYLLGARREIAPRLKALFSEMCWSTETVFAETLERAEAANLHMHCLPQWYDIDTVAELARLKRELIEHAIDVSECPHTMALLLDAYYV